jgi:CDP-paratose 2-epimerase
LAIREEWKETEVFGFDNFVRPGSELNRMALQRRGIKVRHLDLRCASDLDGFPGADWVIDAAANPSVLAGLGEGISSRQVVEHNLGGTINILEYCKRHRAGLILLSTSRVYSIPPLSRLEVEEFDRAYRPLADQRFPDGVTSDGVSEDYSTAAPVSLYGSTKLASESLALEYGAAFDFAVWINRCGSLPARGSSGDPIKGSSVTGSMHGFEIAHSSTSGLMAVAFRCAIAFIRAISCRC